LKRFPSWAEILLLLALLVPSAIFAWENLDMPQFGFQHDDTIYYVCAKAWATGQGHRIISLPEQPWQTKYPPVFPLLLSLVWRIAPEFPANLKIATVLCWLMTPPLLWLIRILYRRYEFPAWWAWVMVAVLAVNPYLQLFSTSLLSEVLFTLLLLGVLLIAPKSAVAAGLLAGLAYLTRTAALPLVVAVPAVYAMRGEWRRAVSFVAAMVPFLAAWAVWAGAHNAHTHDPYLMYYVDYVRYQLYIVNWSNFYVVFWHNFESLLNSAASIVVPFGDSIFTRMLVQTIAVGIIVGVYRLARDRQQTRAYAIYGVLSSAMLVVWHYPPTPRFLFPIFPLLLAGFSYQLAQTVTLIRKAYADPRQKVAAVVVAVVLLLLVVPVIWINCSFLFEVAPATQAGYRKLRAENVAAARRIDAALPPNAKIMVPNDTTAFSANDVTIYLLTGRSAMSMMFPTSFWYEERFDKMVEQQRGMPQVAHEHGLGYIYFDRAAKGNLPDGVQARIRKTFDSMREISPVFTSGEAVLYEIR
jgi:hypothetical protein